MINHLNEEDFNYLDEDDEFDYFDSKNQYSYEIEEAQDNQEYLLFYITNGEENRSVEECVLYIQERSFIDDFLKLFELDKSVLKACLYRRENYLLKELFGRFSEFCDDNKNNLNLDNRQVLKDFARMYHKTASFLIGQYINNPSGRAYNQQNNLNILIPILYLYRHTLELYLKGILYFLLMGIYEGDEGKVDENTPDSFYQHQLKTLWDLIKLKEREFLEIYPETYNGKPFISFTTTKDVSKDCLYEKDYDEDGNPLIVFETFNCEKADAIIGKYTKLDESSMSFRYPNKKPKKLEPHGQALLTENRFTVDDLYDMDIFLSFLEDEYTALKAFVCDVLPKN